MLWDVGLQLMCLLDADKVPTVRMICIDVANGYSEATGGGRSVSGDVLRS